MTISAAEALALYQVMERVARAAGAAKLLLATRVDASGEAQRQGYRTTAELLAKLSGSSLGAAKGDLETSEALAAPADHEGRACSAATSRRSRGRSSPAPPRGTPRRSAG